MSLWNTNALVIEASSAAESLPDPTTVGGRTHELKNNSNGTQTWTSTGATPFVVDGVNVANLVLAVGQARRIYSNGTRWVALPSAVRRVFAGSGVTDASGNVTFTFTPAFASIPVITNAVQTAVTDSTECRITALSVNSVTFNARRAPAVVILGISVLQVPIPLVGATVHCHAIEAGQGV